MNKEFLAKPPESKVQRKWTQALSGTQRQEKRQRTETQEVSSEHLKSERVMVQSKQVALPEQEGGCPENSFNLKQSIIL